MRILMILDKVFPQDERVEKEIYSLINDGHEVRIATYSFDDCQWLEKYGDYFIYRKNISKLMYKLGAAILVSPFYFNYWRRYIRSIYREWQFDAIHIHDLPLAKLGYEMKRKYEVKFVADQHEFYSDWIGKTAHYNRGIGKIIKQLSTWENYERKYLSRADLICTVEQPLKNLYIEKHGIPADKVIIIPNTPLKSMYGKEKRNQKSDSFILFYCGGMDILRGLEIPIKSLKILYEKIPNIKLSIVGKPNKHFDYRAYAAQFGVQDIIELRGWVPFDQLPDEIDQSDVCFFIPPSEREEINNTIATKIYQYIARGKPVIVGRARYMKEFVEQHQIGFAIDESSHEEFADAVLKIHASKDLKLKFEKNARQTAESYYWENTVQPLLEFYRK